MVVSFSDLDPFTIARIAAVNFSRGPTGRRTMFRKLRRVSKAFRLAIGQYSLLMLEDSIQNACLFGHTDRVQAFLSADTALAGDARCLHHASIAAHVDVMKLLLEQGANPSWMVRHQFPLMCAARANSVEALELLIDNGADVAQADLVSHRTALHIAVMHSSIECIQVLLERGADPFALDSWGRAPFEFARTRKVLAVLPRRVPLREQWLAAVVAHRRRTASPLRPLIP